MAKIINFGFGEGIVFDDLKRIVLSKPMNYIKIDNYPANYTFACIFTIADFDYLADNKIKCELFSNNGNCLYVDESVLKPYKTKDELTERDKNSTIVITIGVDFKNIPIENDDIFTAYIFWNDTEIGHFAISATSKEGE